MQRETLYFINIRQRRGEIATLWEYATPCARQAAYGYTLVPRWVYRLARPFLRREFNTLREY